MATYRHYDDLESHATDVWLDDHTVELLLAGRLDRGRADLQSLSSLIGTLRSMPTRVPAVVRPELHAIFESGQAAGAVTPVPARDPNSVSRRRRMLQALSAFVATLAGKVVLGSAAVAAGVGGAHAAGVVDVPGLPDQGSAVVDVPAEVDAPADRGGSDTSGSRPDGETGRPADPGVDGSSVSDRATSGEPQEDGKEFGTSVADEATDGTPAEDLANLGDAADERRSDPPASGADAADEHRPDSPPAGAADTSDQHRPDNNPTDRP